jgi:hypothetical protein
VQPDKDLFLRLCMQTIGVYFDVLSKYGLLDEAWREWDRVDEERKKRSEKLNGN